MQPKTFEAYMRDDFAAFEEWRRWDAGTMASYVATMYVQWKKNGGVPPDPSVGKKPTRKIGGRSADDGPSSMPGGGKYLLTIDGSPVRDGDDQYEMVHEYRRLFRRIQEEVGYERALERVVLSSRVNANGTMMPMEMYHCHDCGMVFASDVGMSNHEERSGHRMAGS